MLEFIDSLQAYRGLDYKITDTISIHQPTLGEICDYGEKQYFSMLNIFTATPYDMIAHLDMMGLDYTRITEFQLFIMLIQNVTTDTTSILFGDVDFSLYKPCLLNDDIVLKHNKSVISEPVYKMIADYMRKIHYIKKQRYNNVVNDFAKQELINEAYADLKKAKMLREKDGETSTLLPLISSLVNYDGFKYSSDTVWDMKIYAFFDAVQRIQTYDNASHLYTGLYSGCVDYDKIKKDLNWMKELKA